MESLEFTNRLQKLLDYYDLSASGFATKIGVQRSSISHVLSGRNKPSLDFVMKLLNNFNEVSIEWLIDGKGTFPKSVATPTPVENDIIKNHTPKIETGTPLAKTPSIDSNKEIVNISSDKQIDKIILLYTDGSFESFKN